MTNTDQPTQELSPEMFPVLASVSIKETDLNITNEALIETLEDYQQITQKGLSVVIYGTNVF